MQGPLACRLETLSWPALPLSVINRRQGALLVRCELHP